MTSTEAGRSGMEELALRCEQATGPDRELDCRINAVVGGVVAEGLSDEDYAWLGSACEITEDGETLMSDHATEMGVPAYTASVDAAMTLVPDGWWVQYLGQCVGGWRGRIERQGCSIPSGMPMAVLKSAALTIAALALRTHLQNQGNPSTGKGVERD